MNDVAIDVCDASGDVHVFRGSPLSYVVEGKPAVLTISGDDIVAEFRSFQWFKAFNFPPRQA